MAAGKRVGEHVMHVHSSTNTEIQVSKIVTPNTGYACVTTLKSVHSEPKEDGKHFPGQNTCLHVSNVYVLFDVLFFSKKDIYHF